MTAECQQVKELVTIDLSTEDQQAAPNSNSQKRVQQGCKNLLCAAEKDKLREEIKVLKQTLADYAASKGISARGGSGSFTAVTDDEPLRYGKVPRQAALNRKWEEIGNGVWICPLRLRAAQKDAKSKTAFARMLLMFFYKKEELKGRRLHELDQDIVHAVAEFALIAKLQSQPKLDAQGDNNGKEGKGKGKERKPQEETKAAIMQSLRTKLNNLIQEDEQKKKRQEKRKQESTKFKELVSSTAAES